MIYLFSEEGFRELDKICQARTLFAFDFDGTLAAIVENPENAKMTVEVESALKELSALAPSAVITGRGLDDIRQKVPFETLHHIGNHGIEGVHVNEELRAQFKNAVAGWMDQLTQFFVNRERDDFLIEDKIYSLSVHYRASKDPHEAVALILEGVRSLEPVPRIIYGDCVVNMVPVGAPHKGDALMELVKREKVEKVFFIGDDQTDEDVFGLDEPSLMAVKVRTPGPVVVPTHAKYYIRSQKEILPLLLHMTERLHKLK